MRVAREQRGGGETIRKRGQEQRGLWRSCRQRARWKVWRERKLAANVLSAVDGSWAMDAGHMGALSGTSGNSSEMISTSFGKLLNCWFY